MKILVLGFVDLDEDSLKEFFKQNPGEKETLRKVLNERKIRDGIKDAYAEWVILKEDNPESKLFENFAEFKKEFEKLCERMVVICNMTTGKNPETEEMRMLVKEALSVFQKSIRTIFEEDEQDIIPNIVA